MSPLARPTIYWQKSVPPGKLSAGPGETFLGESYNGAPAVTRRCRIYGLRTHARNIRPKLPVPPPPAAIQSTIATLNDLVQAT